MGRASRVTAAPRQRAALMRVLIILLLFKVQDGDPCRRKVYQSTSTPVKPLTKLAPRSEPPEPGNEELAPWYEELAPWCEELAPRNEAVLRGMRSSHRGSRSSYRGTRSLPRGARTEFAGRAARPAGLRLREQDVPFPGVSV